MATLRIKLSVPDVDRILRTFDTLKLFRSTDGDDGPFVELTTVATRLKLEAGRRDYEFIDDAGDAAYYYRSSFFHSGSGKESSQSDVHVGDEDPALQLCSVDFLKTNYLFGLDLTNDQGEPFPDSMFEHYIRAAFSWAEKALDVVILPKTFDEETHDYYRQDYQNHLWVQLDHYPVLSVEHVRMVLPPEQEVHKFTGDWLHVDDHSGQITVIPGSGAAGTVALRPNGWWLPLFRGQGDFVPDVFRVKYKAGMSEPPDILLDLIAKKACFGVLNIAGDITVGSGIAAQSLSIDGLSQSVTTSNSSTNAGFGARLIQYAKELKQDVQVVRRHFKGMQMVVS